MKVDTFQLNFSKNLYLMNKMYWLYKNKDKMIFASLQFNDSYLLNIRCFKIPRTNNIIYLRKAYTTETLITYLFVEVELIEFHYTEVYKCHVFFRTIEADLFADIVNLKEY